jgi:hypothetical protein
LPQSLIETRRKRKALRSLIGRTTSLTPQNRPRAPADCQVRREKLGQKKRGGAEFGRRSRSLVERKVPFSSVGLWWFVLTPNLSHPRFTNFNDPEFMQYRKPVGSGPSSNTWPRCASHKAQFTAVRTIPKLVSRSVRTFSSAMGAQKLGHPVPDSNFVSESNSAFSQQMHRYSPFSCRFQYFPVNAISVSAFRDFRPPY